MAEPRQLLKGGLGASSRDLSTLFVVRAVELYLKMGGRFSFVMPFGTLSRRPHSGFIAGKWSNDDGVLTVGFDSPWDLSDIKPLFPMTACVIRGNLVGTAKELPAVARRWQGPKFSQPASDVGTVNIAAFDAADETTYPYQGDFRQGAIIVPRMLLLV